MKRYIEHIKTKEPHERRKHAMQLSGTLVALLFVAWLASFGSRLGIAPSDSTGDTSQTASAANATMMQDGQAQLEVSTTSVYSY